MFVILHRGIEQNQRSDAASSIGIGIATLELGRDVVQIFRRLRQRHIGFEPSDYGEPGMFSTIHVVFIRAQIFQRNVDLSRARQFHIGPEHADYFTLHAIKYDGLADDSARTAEATFP